MNVPHDQDRKVPMPQKLLSTMDFAFSIDTVKINSDINIHIIPKETSGIGTMTINITNGNIFDMRTHHFKNSKPMVLRAEGKLNEKLISIPKLNSQCHLIKVNFISSEILAH